MGLLTKEDALNIHKLLMKRVQPMSAEEGIAIATLATKVAQDFKLVPDEPTPAGKAKPPAGKKP